MENLGIDNTTTKVLESSFILDKGIESKVQQTTDKREVTGLKP